MNYNVFAYCVYLLAMAFIIYSLGKLFHKNGRLFILNLYKGNASATDSINNILLVAYYVFNMGYTLLKLKFWEPIKNFPQLLSSLSSNLGLLILLLAGLHYMNMLAIYLLSRNRNNFLQHTKT